MPSLYPYLLGRTSREYQRLRAQARLWEDATARVFDRVGLGPGMHCLDVGCGPGEVMHLMDDRVGRTGVVVGLDADPQLGREATELLQATGTATFRFVDADITGADHVPGQPFDLVYARMLLMHLPDPVATLRTLDSLVKPGGVPVTQELDTNSIQIWPLPPLWEEFERVVLGVFSAGGLDSSPGPKLPGHFVSAGLGRPDGTDVAGLFLPMPDTAGVAETLYRSALPAALHMDLTTVEDSNRCLAQPADMSDDADHLTMFPSLVSVWIRKTR